MGKQTITEKSFQKMFDDLLGPYPSTKLGNTYLVVVLDHFTKFCFIHLLKKVDSSIMVQNTVFSVFGAQKQYIVIMALS